MHLYLCVWVCVCETKGHFEGVCGRSECTCDWLQESICLWPAVMMHNSQPFGTWSGDPAVFSPACLTLWALFHTAQPSANCHFNEGWSPSYGWWISKKESTCQAGEGGGTECSGRGPSYTDDDRTCLSLTSEVWMRWVKPGFFGGPCGERRGHLPKMSEDKVGSHWSPDFCRMGNKWKKR